MVECVLSQLKLLALYILSFISYINVEQHMRKPGHHKNCSCCGAESIEYSLLMSTDKYLRLIR